MPGEKPARRRYTLPATARVKNSGDFERVMERGVQLGDGRVRLWVARNGLGRTRLGLVVGKRHGPAVTRNRLKRLLREAFRKVRGELPGGLDVLCAPRVGASFDAATAGDSFRDLAARAVQRLPDS